MAIPIFSCMWFSTEKLIKLCATKYTVYCLFWKPKFAIELSWAPLFIIHWRKQNTYSQRAMIICTIWHKFTEASESCAPLGTYSLWPPKIVHHLAHIRGVLRKLCTTWHIFAEVSESCAPLAHIRRGLQKLCITWHIFAEVSESYAPRGTYSQKPPKIVHHLAHIPRGLRKLFTTWHIFTRLSE